MKLVENHVPVTLAEGVNAPQEIVWHRALVARRPVASMETDCL